VIRREIVGLGLAHPANLAGRPVVQVEMVEEREDVVEKLGVHRPRAVFPLSLFADDLGT
jgi:hypothetical protein